MKVRITLTPTGVVDGMSLHDYHAGEVYEIPSVLAGYLVAAGYASVEMRHGQRRSQSRKYDRRSQSGD